MKVVINSRHGAFTLSREAVDLCVHLGMPRSMFVVTGGCGILKNDTAFRSHDVIIHAVESLGEVSDGPYSKLKILQIPDGVNWNISQSLGREIVCEVAREWR